MDRAVVVYDRECGFCRRAVRRLLAWDRGSRLRTVALQDPEADRLLAPVEPACRTASWHLVNPDGRVFSAGAAIAPLLRLLRGGAPVAFLAAAFPGTTERLYRWVARHRSGLGRALGANTCGARPPTGRSDRP